MTFSKQATILTAGLVLSTLAACGSSATSTSPAPASATLASSAAPVAGSPVAAGAAPASSAASVPANVAVVGAKAPGPYSVTGSPITAAAGQPASLDANDQLKYSPNTIVVTGGQQVTLQIKNTGSTAHTFISPGLNVATSTDVAIGKTTNVVFTAPTAPGAYQFWCNIPGHAEAGMVGEVIVR